MNAFKDYHPLVNFIYFVLVTGFSMFMMHPVFLAISLVSALGYLFILSGRQKAVKSILLMIPLMLVAAIVNPAFNHKGVTVICNLWTGNPLTAESLIFGAAAALLLASVVILFSCFNAVMTSDKFIYLFGKIIPVLSLVISMTLRFVPNFLAKLREIINAQRCIGRDISKGSIIKRYKQAVKIFSILVTWSLENAVETADSMKSRGYGLPGRSVYSIYCFEKKDLKALLWLALLSAIVFAEILNGNLYYRYFPSIVVRWNSPAALIGEAAYLLLSLTPIIIEGRELARWKAIKSKI